MDINAVAFAALGLSLACVILLVPLYGKTFFSTHRVQYLPIEEYIKTRKDLGYEQPDPIESAEKKAKQLSDKLFGVPNESFASNDYYQPKLKKKNPQAAKE